MREIIDEVLNGNYGSETGSLDFSQPTLECLVRKGEDLSGSFWIRSDGANSVSGRVLSTDYRMEVLTPDFLGAESEISYVFHAKGLETEEVVKGAFRVISSLGEYSLPYVVTCETDVLLSSIGPIHHLNQFAKLARENWQEALSLFYSDSFVKILMENDPELVPVYRGLAITAGQEQNMEEFLISAEKKRPVEFSTDTLVLSYEASSSEGEWQLMERELNVQKNGWGCVALNVDCDGPFLCADKEVLREDDFLGNTARFPFFVDGTRLKPGKNTGKLVFYNSFVSFEVEVNVTMGEERTLRLAKIEWQQTIASIMRQYELFRTRRIGLQSWLEKTESLVDKLIAMDEKSVMACLFKAQILITKDCQNEARWMLAHVAELMERQRNRNEELWAYYLYLTTLISREEEQIIEVTGEVEAIYHQNPDSWRIAWLLLYLSEEYASIPSEKLRFLELQYERGCRSFVIYVEALQLFLGNPALLRKIGPFERQVLFYGIRRDYFSPDVAERFIGLMEKEKEYSPLLCRILRKLYQKKKDTRILSKICELFVRGGIYGERALPWYEKGIDEQLRITNLYEAFMASVDPDERKNLPKAAVLYFSYQNKLDYERSAFLYDYVLDNKVLFEDVYDKYVIKCRDFVLEQVSKGRINRHLARLYSKMITSQMITDQNAENLVRLLFMTRIRVKDDRMRKVILYAKGSSVGREYPLSGGETIAPVYGRDTTMLFEDAFGNRFTDKVSKELEQYAQPDSFVRDLEDKDTKIPEFDLWLLCRANEEPWGELLQEKALRLLGGNFLDRETQKEFCLRLMKQFYEGEQPEKMDEVLQYFRQMNLTPAERMEVAKYAVLRGNYDLPTEWMKEIGPYFLDANTLARVVGNVILNGCGEDACMIAASNYLFLRGKASAAMLEYLSTYGEGTLKELRDLWKAMVENNLDVTSLEERLLIQLIFTGGYVAERTEIFERYYRTAGETSVVRAYVIQGSFDYFVREKTAEGIWFRTLLDDYKAGVNLPKVCKLAYLKYYAENPDEVSREVDGTLDAFLREMMTEKIHFGFYKKLRHQRHLLGELSDKVIVEYRTKPGGRAKIHYVITEGDDAERDYVTENMRDVFWGICCKEFVLFFGETCIYHVTEEIDGKETLTVQGSLQCPELDAETAATKYGIVNDAIMSQSLKDDAALDEALEQYYFKEFCGEKLFVMQ